MRLNNDRQKQLEPKRMRREKTMTMESLERIGSAFFWALVGGAFFAYDAAMNIYGIN